jgi:membrane protein implicated in regulation of membrane protease activity
LFLYSYLGTLGQLWLNLARGKSHPRVIEYWVWLGGFATAAVILILLGRVALKLLEHVQEEQNKQNETQAGPLDLAAQPIYVARPKE